MMRTRIAPSPTGIAHLGTAYTALRNWALARNNGGKFIIRVEDTDRDRYVPQAVDVIFEALAWLGIDYDEGPNLGGPHSPYTQSERLNLYQQYAQTLIDQGQAYYCFCTKARLDQVRQTQLAKKELPRYDGYCRNLDPAEAKRRAVAGEPHVIRLKTPKKGTTVLHDVIRGKVSWDNSGIDDQVLLKSDGFPTYHLAVVVDDHLMGITHVIRGEEWLSSTPKHLLLYQAFGWDLPVFAHLPLIRNKDKSKMSKRKNDVSILSYRDKGYLPAALNNFLCLMGWSHPEKKEIFPLSDFVKYFTLERVTTTAPAFDLPKLNWLNGQYIRTLSDQELLTCLNPFVPADCPTALVPKLIPLIKERLVTLADFEPLTKFFYRNIVVDQALLHKYSNPIQVKTQLTASINLLNKLSDYSPDKLEQSFRHLSDELSWQPRQFFSMLRTATTSEQATPPLFATMSVLGKELVLSRLQKLL